MEERLQKYMARAGVASRRHCETIIAEGRVAVDGEVVTEPGVKVDPERAKVTVDGKPLRRAGAPVYLMMYKTGDVTTTASDELGRRTVMDLLPPGLASRVYPVGRLDRDSEGLLLFTNDGELAHFLTHPAHGVVKTYRVTVEGRFERSTASELLSDGIRLGPIVVKPRSLEILRADDNRTALMVSVAEGINREVRRMFAALGHEVVRLVRVQVGPLSLKGIKRGECRPLTAGELSGLRRLMERESAGERLEEERERYPAGSSAERKPAGPRGRHAGRDRGSSAPNPRRPKTDRAEREDEGPRRFGAGVGSARGASRRDDWRRGKPDPAALAAGLPPGKTREKSFGRKEMSRPTFSEHEESMDNKPRRPFQEERPRTRHPLKDGAVSRPFAGDKSGTDKPRFGKDKPAGSAPRPAYPKRPTGKPGSPDGRGNRPGTGGRPPVSDRPARPAFKSGEQGRSFGKRDDKPAYPGRPARPDFAGRPERSDRPARPAFKSGEQGRSFGKRDDKPAYPGRPARPAFKSGEQGRSFGKRDDKPAYPGRPARPDFAGRPERSDRPSRPAFKSGEQGRSFGKRDDKPAYPGRPARSDFAGRPERPGRPGGAKFSARPERMDRPERPRSDRRRDEFDFDDRPARIERSLRGGRGVGSVRRSAGRQDAERGEDRPTSRVYPAGNPHAPGGPPKRNLYVREYYREKDGAKPPAGAEAGRDGKERKPKKPFKRDMTAAEAARPRIRKDTPKKKMPAKPYTPKNGGTPSKRKPR